jgi:multicomponent Na+:H+ antiporter subunit D
MGGWGKVFALGISGIVLVLDGLSLLLLITVNGVTLLCLFYSTNYMKSFTAQWKFYTLVMLMLGGMNGVVLTGDMFNLYVFMEIAGIATYALVAFGTEHEELEAAFKYMVMGSLASIFILFSIALLYGKTGVLNMADMSKVIAETGRGDPLFLFTGGLLLMGFALKAALVPFHSWLPDAHPSAPAPISAMLSGVFIKALGVYALARIFFNVFGFHTETFFTSILLGLGTLSIVISALLALGQKDMKRLLAYSSISQVGYIALGLGLANPLGIAGALFHVINHAVGKSLLFLTSGAVVHSAHTRNLDEMGGLSERMPVTGSSFLAGSLQIAGVPPLGGFFSKLLIVLGCIHAGRYGLAVIAVGMGVLTLAYLLKVERQAFFGQIRKELGAIREAPAMMCTAMILLAVVALGLGVFSPFILDNVVHPARDALLQGIKYATVVLGGK